VPFASALSRHPDAATAVGETTGEILERLGDSPDVTFAFVSQAHVGSIAAIHSAIRHLLSGSLIGAVSNSVIGGRVEAENAPALVLWAAHLDDATPVRFMGTGPDLLAMSPDVMPEIGDREDLALIVIADPLSFAVDSTLERLGKEFPKLTVVGGMVAPTSGPGGARLFCDDDIHSAGAVGLLVGGHQVSTVLSQGCRLVGSPMTVTAANQNVISELAGRPALSQLEHIVASLTHGERLHLNETLHIGRVVDERLETFGAGDFLIRGVVGTDKHCGAVVTSDAISVGDTVQFQLRDARTATADMQAALRRADPAAGALVFTCNGRGSNLFSESSHDARAIGDRFGTDAVAGMFCAGEIGPVGQRSFVHGISAAVALFSDATSNNTGLLGR